MISEPMLFVRLQKLLLRQPAQRPLLASALLFLTVMMCDLSPTQAQQIQGYSHRHWGVEEGAPSHIQAISQTRDGFLWLGTSSGLYRFDGITFEKIEPENYSLWRSNQITALAAAPDGALWIGYDFGGVGVYRNGHLSDANIDKHPRGQVFSIAVGRDGDVWVAVNGNGGTQLRRLHRGKWITYGPGDVFENDPIQSLFVARDGTLWIAQYSSLRRLRPGATKSEKVPVEVGNTTAFAEDESGALWLASNRGLQRLTEPRRLIRTDDDTPAIGFGGQQSLLFDEGIAWLAGHKEGLIRRTNLVNNTGKLEVIPVHSVFLFRDREGTIWGGGSDGLVSYIRSPLLREDVNGSLVTGIAKAPDTSGPLYVGTQTGVYEIAKGSPRMVLEANYVDLVCAGPSGKLWVSTSRGRFFRQNGSWSFPDNLIKKFSDTGCAFDADGGLWVTVGGYGIYHLVGRSWERPIGWPTAHSIISDGDQGLYGNRPTRAVLHLLPDSAREIWSGDDIAIGFIRTMKRVGSYIYFGGEKGLARFDGKRFAVLSVRDHPWLTGITGFAIGRTDAWVITSEGVVRMPADDLGRAFAAPRRVLGHEIISAGVGVTARSFAYTANDAEIDAQGRVWFVTNRGLFRIDPSRIQRNQVPPPVNIRNLVANGRSYAPGNVTLPPGTSRIQLDYVAISLTDPAKNNYRYRLDDVDATWIDAGNKRQANYTGLGPGSYRFRVIAANPDGVWNNTGATMAITIMPFFWQTWLFKGVLLLFFGLLLWAFIQWRIRAAAEHTRQRIEDRLAVREHIAQELHDTLLQGFQGLVLRFQSIVERIPFGDPARTELESTLERADDVLHEGRDRVRFLREDTVPVDLAPILSKIAQDVLDGHLRWTLKEVGTAHPICAPVADDIARIASEAVFNALRHARANAIEIRIVYARDSITISILDDGIGLDPAVKRAGRREGHYGLIGMRERATRLGATLRTGDAPTNGTEVQLTVPARIAYR